MRKEPKPDHLDETAAAACEAGMSYGKYVALEYERRKRENVQVVELGFAPEGMRLCRKCGKAFKKYRSIAFCSDACRTGYQQERKCLHRIAVYEQTGK